MSKRLVAILVILLIVVGGGAFLYYPRGESLSATVAATLSVLNTDITAQRGGTGDFATALDGDIYKTGDVVKSSQNGRAVLTFFDGSSLTVDPGSQVRVATLNRLDNGGIQVTIEQNLGRTWASVQKLKTPDSKFEIKTPTSTAAVRGTAFVTNVVQQPDGTLRVTYEADDGQLLVSAAAGGTTTVNANQSVAVNTNQQAPGNANQLPPQPSLRVTSTANTGFAVTGPKGATCGSQGNKTEIFGCLQNGNTITVRGPDAGRYGVLMTASAAVQNATLTAELLLGGQVQASKTFTRTFNLGDLVRTGFELQAGGVGNFEPGELVTSICGAVGRGRVFSGGTFQERTAAVQAYGQTSHGADVAFVATEAELNAEIQKAMAANAGYPVSDVKVTVGTDGIHASAQLKTPIGSFSASGEVAMGPVNGKLAFKIRNLSAGPVPAAILDQAQAAIDKNASSVADSFPFEVRQVALRTGCFAIMGVTR